MNAAEQSRHEVGVVGPIDPGLMERLRREYVVHPLWECAAGALPGQVTAIVTDGRFGASASLIDGLPGLRLIACNGIGIDAIALDVVRQRGVTITTTPDVLTDDVADMAVALLLAVSRRIVEGDRFARSGAWGPSRMAPGRRLGSKTVGIVGLGRIGRAVARRLTAFGMRITYTDVAPSGEPHIFVPDLVALAKDADFLVVTAPGGAATRGLVNRAVLDALGPEGVLVNVARGSIVDEPALVQALTQGTLGGAGLDVFADEPNIPDALKTMSNVVLEPHIASATAEGRRAMAALVMDNLRAHFAGAALVTPLVLP